MINVVEKKWGKEEWLVNSESYCAKYLYLVYGHSCSLHWHKKKDETFYILEGKVVIEISEPLEIHKRTDSQIEIEYKIDRKMFFPGEQVRILPWTLHRFYCISDNAKMLEVSTHHEDSDSYRLEPSF